MSNALRVASEDAAFVAGAVLALVLNVGLYLYVWSIDAAPTVALPFGYETDGTATLVGTVADLGRLPVIGSLLALVNIALGIGFHAVDRLAARTLVWTAPVIQGLIAGGVLLLLLRAGLPLGR